MNSKTVNTLPAVGEILDHTIEAELKNKIHEAISKFGTLFSKISQMLNNDWVEMKNSEIWYNHKIRAVMPNTEKFTLQSSNSGYSFDSGISLAFYQFEGELPTEEDLEKIIYDPRSPIINGEHIKNKDGALSAALALYNHKYTVFSNIDTHISNYVTYSFNDGKWGDVYYLPINHIGITDDSAVIDIFMAWQKNRLTPAAFDDFAENESALIQSFNDLLRNKYITVEASQIKETDRLITDCLYGKIKEINGINFSILDIMNSISEGKKIHITEYEKEVIERMLLKCDEKRANIEPYARKILSDPNSGHWDLWSGNNDETIITDMHLVARNPEADIQYDGVVGIDFGTKSTVVAYQKDGEFTMPMRVGMARYSVAATPKDYENPTIMEFINIGRFLKDYSAKQGRPATNFEDLTISHTAKNDLDSSKSDDYYNFFSELKQWAGNKDRQIRITDKKGKYVRDLKAYIDLDENDFDPIEIYAYYIGLYINNMHNGIYLDYKLSFPVTFEVAIREKILESFRKGLKKSLPSSILENEDVMDEFFVEQGASEPAAYAVCAMQEYKFEPQKDENIYYAVFDFGGGTTDFDYGIWREANETERRYDYVIEHFGASGDIRLGGENLLELLAFNVFKNNQDILRKDETDDERREGFTFTKPLECKEFAGSEALIAETQEAHVNTKRLVERLRPLWEHNEAYSENMFKAGKLHVDLFDKNGQEHKGVTLNVDMKGLEEMIEERVEKGINNFFYQLKSTFDLNDPSIKKINILLAGNSSKADIVRKLFDKHMKEESAQSESMFEIFPPLGTDEAKRIQAERGNRADENDITRPTGKTGVVFGLIECREGGRIKVVDNNKSKEQDEIKFQYYIGYNNKGSLQTVINPDSKYGEWKKFIDAGVRRFELYYTTQPTANSNNLSIKETTRKKCSISVIDDNAFVYIRPVKPSQIEYVVAFPESISNNEYLSDITVLDI